MRIALVLLPVLLALLPLPVEGVVRRCIGPDGTMIYTDRRCEQLDARDAPPPKPPEPVRRADDSVGDTSVPRPATTADQPQAELPLSAYGPAHTDCARTPESLLFNLRRALENRDVNALAALYHWRGMGDRSANAVMVALERLIARADGSADLVYPETGPDDFFSYAGYSSESSPDTPSGVRISTFQRGGAWGNAVTEAEQLSIVRNAGCWWVHF